MSFIKHLLPAWKQKLTGTSTNAVMLSAIEDALSEAEKDTIEGKVVMELETSTGEWLDQYGSLFGPRRRDKESDDTYRDRLIEYVQLERGTIPAIKDAIRSFIEHDTVHIDIYEPWRNIFYLNRSKLNGPDHFLGHYYTFAVIDIRITSVFPESIMDVIREFKPAGVKVHLTYNPSSHNPNASIVELPLQASTVHNTITNLEIMNGLDDRIRGHVNLTNRSRDEDDDSGLFITNKSKLNSKDRLAGSLSAGMSTFNLATYSKKDIRFGNTTEMGDVLDKTAPELGDEQETPLSTDFYTRTGTMNNQYAEVNIDGVSNNYLYMTFDIGTYFDINYQRFLREVEPGGIYDRDTYLGLIEKPTIQYKIGAQVPTASPASLNIQILNIRTNKWEIIEQSKLTFHTKEGLHELHEISDYLSETNIVFTRIHLPKHPKGDYDLRVHFFEIGFKKEVSVRTTVNGEFEVTSSGKTVPI